MQRLLKLEEFIILSRQHLAIVFCKIWIYLLFIVLLFYKIKNKWENIYVKISLQLFFLCICIVIFHIKKHRCCLHKLSVHSVRMWEQTFKTRWDITNLQKALAGGHVCQLWMMLGSKITSPTLESFLNGCTCMSCTVCNKSDGLVTPPRAKRQHTSQNYCFSRWFLTHLYRVTFVSFHWVQNLLKFCSGSVSIPTIYS